MFENAVKEKNVLSNSAFPPEQADIHIAFGISADFTYPVGVLITSILENNRDLKIAFHIFIDGSIALEENKKFMALLFSYNTSITIYGIDNSIFTGLDDREFTIAAYYRFVIPYQLKNIASRCLYLDADIICLNSLDSFSNIAFAGTAACVVEDFELDKNNQPILTVANTGYFNSGMIYIDVQQWLHQQISEKCIALLREVNEHPERKKVYGYAFQCFDQDALNVILKDKAIHLAPSYNFLCNISLKKNAKVEKIPVDTIFLHYHGFNKPWHEWCFHPLARYFRKYWKLSPWKDTPLDTRPAKYRQMRLYAKYFMKKGAFFTSLYWVYRSVVKKYIPK